MSSSNLNWINEYTAKANAYSAAKKDIQEAKDKARAKSILTTKTIVQKMQKLIAENKAKNNGVLKANEIVADFSGSVVLNRNFQELQEYFLPGMNLIFNNTEFKKCSFAGFRFPNKTDLNNAKFTGCQLISTDFSNADLQDSEFANMDFGDMREVNFNAANMNNCRFKKCDLRFNSFRGTKLRNASFDGDGYCFRPREAYFEGNIFQGADMKAAQFTDFTHFDGIKGADLRFAQLHNLTLNKVHIFEDCDLRFASFSPWVYIEDQIADLNVSNSKTHGLVTSFVNVDQVIVEEEMIFDLKDDLSHLKIPLHCHPNFNGMFLQEVNFDGIEFHPNAPVNFENAELVDASFVETPFPERVKFDNSNACLADFTGAQLPKASFFRVLLNDAIFEKANLQGANFKEASLDKTNLVSADLTEADFTKAHLYLAQINQAILHKAKVETAQLDQTWEALRRGDDKSFNKMNRQRFADGQNPYTGVPGAIAPKEKKPKATDS